MRAESTQAPDREEFIGLKTRRYQPSTRRRVLSTARSAYTGTSSKLRELKSKFQHEKRASLGKAPTIGIPAAALVGAGAYLLGKKKKKALSSTQKANLRIAKLKSSMIRGAGRSKDGTTIEFSSGRKYRFKNVPEHIYQGLLRASSHGQYFNQHIRGKYDYEIV